MARALVPALAMALSGSLAWSKPDGTCGHQCTEASECGGCGTAGTCSCPNGKAPFYQTSCTCVSAPKNPPADPKADVGDSAWPSQWTANVDVYNYKDWTDKVEEASGKFYFDATLGKTRLDWLVGKKGKQVWVGSGPGHATSDYYATVGPVCLKFPITDPGQQGKPVVGIEYPDWMTRCKEAGFGTYVGREQVRVGAEDVWVDHWSCRLDYINSLTNQSITFQNWHSLGLGSAAKGLPVRVTGGNSKPDPNQAPRLNSVWYSDFVAGANATKAEDFEPPKNPFGLPCVPLMAAEVERFFGHPATTEHVFSPAFHRRAAFLPHARADERDLKRARRPKPSSAFKGASFGEAMRKLNAVLVGEKGLKTQRCSDFDVDSLHEMQRLLFDARTPELDGIYAAAADARRMAHGNAASLEGEQARLLNATMSDSALAAKMREGACHEMVMWYVHHLSASAREELKESLVLPLLPEALREAPLAAAPPAHVEAHRRYTEQASCAVCHVGAGEQTLVV